MSRLKGFAKYHAVQFTEENIEYYQNLYGLGKLVKEHWFSENEISYFNNELGYFKIGDYLVCIQSPFSEEQYAEVVDNKTFMEIFQDRSEYEKSKSSITIKPSGEMLIEADKVVIPGLHPKNPEHYYD